MFFALSKTLDLALSPLTWAILLAAVGAFRGTGRWAVFSRWAPLAAATVLYFFSLPEVANALEARLERSAPDTAKPDRVYDAVILLGGLVAHDATETWGEASYNDNVERLLTTYSLLRTGRARSAILSGGRSSPEDPIVEARVLARQLSEWGIDPARLVLEEASRNTRENAVFSGRLAEQKGFRSLVVVTSAFHMRRSLEAFHAVGLSPDALPVDHRTSDTHRGRSWLPRAEYLFASSHALRELFGTWVYRATA